MSLHAEFIINKWCHSGYVRLLIHLLNTVFGPHHFLVNSYTIFFAEIQLVFLCLATKNGNFIWLQSANLPEMLVKKIVWHLYRNLWGWKNGKYCNINFCSALWHYIATLFSLVSVLLPGTDNSNPILRLQMRRKRATSKDAPFAKVFLAIVLTKEFIYKIDALVVMWLVVMMMKMCLWLFRHKHTT